VVRVAFIVMFGSSIAALSQRDGTFIIGTRTQATTTSAIWSVFRRAITRKGTPGRRIVDHCRRSILKGFGRLQRLGTGQKRDWPSIAILGRWATRGLFQRLSPVPFAAIPSYRA